MKLSSVALAMFLAPAAALTPTIDDINTWNKDVLPAADTARTTDCATDSVAFQQFLKALGEPTDVTAGPAQFGGYQITHYEFKDGTDVQVASSNAGTKIVSCTPGTGSDSEWIQPDTLTDREFTEARKAFSAADKNGDGQITAGGAYSALESSSMIQTLPKDVVETAVSSLSQIDPNGDGMVQISEYLMMLKIAKEIQGMYTEFKKFDTDGSGTLSVSEFQQAAQDWFTGQGISDAKAKEYVMNILDVIDVDHSNDISFEEFVGDLYQEEQAADLDTDTHLSTVAPDAENSLTEQEQLLSFEVFLRYVEMLTEMNPADVDGEESLAPGDVRDMFDIALDMYIKQSGIDHDMDCRPTTRPTRAPRMVRLLQRVPVTRPTGGSGATTGAPRTGGKAVVRAVRGVLGELKDLDTDKDRRISIDEFAGLMSAIKAELTPSDFEAFIEVFGAVQPVMCDKNPDCGSCAEVPTCGWLSYGSKTDSYYASYYGGMGGVCVHLEGGRDPAGDVNGNSDTAGTAQEGDKCQFECTSAKCVTCDVGLVCGEVDTMAPTEYGICVAPEACVDKCDASDPTARPRFIAN